MSAAHGADFERDGPWKDDRRGRSVERRHERVPSRSPSPIPDFGDVSKRWTGWDKPTSRYPLQYQHTPGSGQGHPHAHGHSRSYHHQASSGYGGPHGEQSNFQYRQNGEGDKFSGRGMPTSQDQYQVGGSHHGSRSVVPNAAASLPGRQQRRLYVGNLPPQFVEQDLINFLNASMAKIPGVLLSEGPAVLSIDVMPERAYAFIELRSADEATFLTAFDGLPYEGHSLRIHRPREWVASGNEPPLPEISPAALGIISPTVQDGPNKIFIGGLPTQLNEADVKRFLLAIGPLKSFNLVRDANGSSRAFAFCEYLDPELTDVACQSFNGRKYGDRQLIVQRSQPGSKGTSQSGSTKIDNQAPTSSSASIILNDAGQQILAPESQTGQTFANSLLTTSVSTEILLNTLLEKAKQAQDSPAVSNIIALLNAVDISCEWEDDYYQALNRDMAKEAPKYGTVIRICIPRAPPKPKKQKIIIRPGELSSADVGAGPGLQKEATIPPPPGFGKIFIEYSNPSEAKAALTGLSGRKYDGRMIITAFANSIPS